MKVSESCRLVAVSLFIPVLLSIKVVSAADGPPRQPGWEPIGLSGGGAMFAPAISPRDGRLMMVNCDMSAAYISTRRRSRMADDPLQPAPVQHAMPAGVSPRPRPRRSSRPAAGRA